ncbi:DUF2778 domain-containing protein [uncultured Alsobacter sp.]|uniref:DUF2778 domain-containing protein n=1 Tax=uncultured Alsobacter sp. TaxID=1748258 RepID=UPI0025D72E75|nr:DUF2778 domain-containing protein [uncultured Alsobacter sp.]
MSEYFGRRHQKSVRPLSPRRSAPLWFLLLPAIPVGVGLWASLPLQPVPDAPRIDLSRLLPGSAEPAKAPGPHEEMIRLGFAHQSTGQAAPLASTWQPVAPPAPPIVAAAPALPEPAKTAALPLPPPPTEARPVPAPRPAELVQQTPVPERPRVANASIQRRARMSVASAPAAPAQDNRSFFERLFGGTAKPAGDAMAYAPSQDDGADLNRSRRLGRVTPSAGELTAVYDISAKAVYLPSGEKLEAHSGLGDHLDDPRYVHVRMKGATPPHVYDLTLREALFHGVRAIRLTPIGGSGAIHGRDGLLAHTYMLGPNGDSNGCVSIRNYERFLQAYLKGEIRKLVVVASAN